MSASSRIRKVVIPAAGIGRRFLPATKVIPKEMLPIAGRPLIQLAVEEAVASGVETVILVIGRGKNLLQEHFHRNVGLEEMLTQRGYHEDAESIRRLSQLAEIRTAWQQAPLGLADAIRSARSLVADEPFAVILPDAVIDSDEPCVGQLKTCYERHPGCIIATRLVNAAEVERFGILDLIPMRDRCCGGRVSRVNSLTERPRPGTTSSRYGIFGRYILEPGIFEAIDQTHPGFGGELQLTDALLASSSSIPLYAFRFVGEHYDAGSTLGFLQANLAYALKDPQVAPWLRKYLASLQPDSDSPSIATACSA
jgi:UTP--glucose-1-phosphate uridylyltransferase